MSSLLGVYHHGGFTGACGGSTSGDKAEFIIFGFNSLFERELIRPVDWSKTVDGENTENIVYELCTA